MSDLLQIGANALVAAGQAVDRTAQNIARITAPSYPPPPTDTNDYLDDQPEDSSVPVFSPPLSGGGAVFAQDAAFSQNASLQGPTFSDDALIMQSFAMIAATTQYQAAASLVDTGYDLGATLLQTIA